MEEYNDKSFEELRFEDYLSDKNGLQKTARFSRPDDSLRKSIANLENSSNEHENSLETDCPICCESKSDTYAFVPCGHAIACENCCVKLTFGEEPKKRICPICREKITQYIKVFL